MNLDQFIQRAFEEDCSTGDDYTSLACIPEDRKGRAVLKIKGKGILAGVAVAKAIFDYLEPDTAFNFFLRDGDEIDFGMKAFEVNTSVRTILKAERLVLNCMQRMSGIATLTRSYVDLIKDTPAKILDTRKTTPLFRYFEKEAVRIGGGFNHRMGLYDMIMLKDNHIDYCGGISKAIQKAQEYLKQNNLELPIEIETRNLEDVRQVLNTGGVQRIMLDNYTPEMMGKAVQLIGRQYETEASGGINKENILEYAQTGVDYISVGALTHHAVSLDLSLKAV